MKPMLVPVRSEKVGGEAEGEVEGSREGDCGGGVSSTPSLTRCLFW